MTQFHDEARVNDIYWSVLKKKNEIEVEVFIYLFIEKQSFFSFHHRRAHKLFKCIFTIFKAFFENNMCKCVVNNPQKHLFLDAWRTADGKPYQSEVLFVT